MLTIGITTFKRRLESVSQMISYLKKCDPDIKIILGINGEIDEPFDDDYRKKILEICLKFDNIFPFFYQEFRSLAKIWNNIVISSVTEFNLILNDDLIFDQSQNFVQIIKNVIEKNKSVECFTVNGSFSHFVITKKFLDTMGYFDERFLLHGEEDGDFVWRYIDKYGNYPPSLNLPILSNLHQSGHKDPTVIANNTEIGYSDKPRFNQEFTVTKYVFDPTSKISGMYGRPHRKVLLDSKQYPYENFFFRNKHNFKKFQKINLDGKD